MRVPFFDPGRQTEQMRRELAEALMRVVDSNALVLGDAVEQLEDRIAGTLGVAHAIGVGSGSDALLLSLMAAGIGPGAEVLVPTFSAFPAASAPARLGARVVFADIDFQTCQVDPGEVRRRITSRTRAVIVGHLFGSCADMLQIQSIAADHGILIIEDAAQAFGARYRGQAAGTMGFCGCLSFDPSSNLAAIGDAGMVVTNDATAAERIRQLRVQGTPDGYEYTMLGIHSPLDAVQAAALSLRLPHVEAWNQRRRSIADRYMTRLAGIVSLPVAGEYSDSVYNPFVIRTPERDALRERLEGHGIRTEIYCAIPLHLQPGLGSMRGAPGDYPRAEEAARTSLALPIFPELEDAEVDHVIAKIQEFFA